MSEKKGDKNRRSEAFGMATLLRPHWRAVSLAFLAVLGEILADLLEPWPLKMVIDYVLQGKHMPAWLAEAVSKTTGHDPIAVLNAAVARVAGVALLGAGSAPPGETLDHTRGQGGAH